MRPIHWHFVPMAGIGYRWTPYSSTSGPISTNPILIVAEWGPDGPVVTARGSFGLGDPTDDRPADAPGPVAAKVEATATRRRGYIADAVERLDGTEETLTTGFLELGLGKPRTGTEAPDDALDQGVVGEKEGRLGHLALAFSRPG
jgi:hypothetical protein